MAKGQQKFKEHQEKVALLGKPLLRRARKRCELCEESGVSLRVLEVAPTPAEPDPDHAIMVCSTCEDAVSTEKPDANGLRFLESIIWSEVQPVQVTAVRLCRKLAAAKVNWAQALLETVYLSPEVEEWLKASE